MLVATAGDRAVTVRERARHSECRARSLFRLKADSQVVELFSWLPIPCVRFPLPTGAYRLCSSRWLISQGVPVLTS